MQEASLPSPAIGAKGYHLRRVAANAISHLEVTALGYADGASPSAAAVKTFFDACSAAALTASLPNPVMTLATTGDVTSLAVSATNQLIVGKGGSSGTVTYVSSDPAIATVNGSGLVTGVAVGTVTLTANMTQGAAHKAASKSITLTITA